MYRLILLILISFSIQAQIGIGEWRLHVPLNQGRQVVNTPDKVFMSTSFSLLEYDKESFEVKEWSKINGLSDNGVNSVAFDPERNQVVIGYSNGNIDLLKSGSVSNISDIKRFNLASSKVINDIYVYNDFAYLSCGFGIVVLDLERKEIKETYYIGDNASYINIRQIAISNDSIHAATESGLYQAGINSNNLADFNNWTINQKFDTEFVASIGTYNDLLFVNQFVEGFSNDSLWYSDGVQWTLFNEGIPDDFYEIEENDGDLLLSGSFKIYVYSDIQTVKTDIYTYGELSPQPNMVVKGDKENEYWIADRFAGLVHSLDRWNHTLLSPNTVNYEFAYALDASSDVVYSAGGGLNSAGNNIWNASSGQRYSENAWTSFVFNNQEGFNDTLYDMVDVTINPNNTDEVFFASHGRGLVETNNGIVQEVYRDHNSIIEASTVDGFYFSRIGAVTFDDEGRLWIGNSFANENLKLKDGDDWYSFDLGSSVNSNSRVRNIYASSRYNQVWISFEDGNIVVYHHNGTIDDTADDDFQLITNTANGGNLPDRHVNVINEDKDGEIWVGTDKGVAVFYNPSAIFNGTNDWSAQQIIIQQGEYFQNLLESSVITDMFVDGANQKWFATQSNGVYLFSANGQEEIHHFTTENSPLLSNTVQSITVHEQTGEVFMGTENGIISFRGVATEAKDYFQDVYAFPNPVRPGYSGNIGISGLVRDAIVKITDISGNLVYETRAEGGQASWDGKRLDGEAVSSGVYLVFCSDDLGEQTLATKILIVR